MKAVVRQAVEEHLPVALLGNSIIQQNQHAAIGLAADQPPESLFQRQRRLGNLIIVKRIAALFSNALDPGFHHRVAGNRERQLVDDNAAQLVALHVHALPKRRGREQHAVRRGAKFIQQRAARAGALHQRWVVDFERHAIIDHAHLLIAGEQHEGPPAAVAEECE